MKSEIGREQTSTTRREGVSPAARTSSRRELENIQSAYPSKGEKKKERTTCRSEFPPARAFRRRSRRKFHLASCRLPKTLQRLKADDFGELIRNPGRFAQRSALRRSCLTVWVFKIKCKKRAPEMKRGNSGGKFSRWRKRREKRSAD